MQLGRYVIEEKVKDKTGSRLENRSKYFPKLAVGIAKPTVPRDGGDIFIENKVTMESFVRLLTIPLIWGNTESRKFVQSPLFPSP
jgi:hypothetical protein